MRGVSRCLIRHMLSLLRPAFRSRRRNAMRFDFCCVDPRNRAGAARRSTTLHRRFLRRPVQAREIGGEYFRDDPMSLIAEHKFPLVAGIRGDNPDTRAIKSVLGEGRTFTDGQRPAATRGGKTSTLSARSILLKSVDIVGIGTYAVDYPLQFGQD